MHHHAFTPIEGLWLSKNLPCSEEFAVRSASAHEMQLCGRVALFERSDPLVITRDQSAMRCTNLRVQRQILGGLLLRPPAAIIGEVLVHIATPVLSRAARPLRLTAASYPHSSRCRINCLT